MKTVGTGKMVKDWVDNDNPDVQNELRRSWCENIEHLMAFLISEMSKEVSQLFKEVKTKPVAVAWKGSESRRAYGYAQGRTLFPKDRREPRVVVVAALKAWESRQAFGYDLLDLKACSGQKVF